MHTGLRTEFLLTPLREGRRANACGKQGGQGDFYSRPCGRGDVDAPEITRGYTVFLLTPLREGRQGNTEEVTPYGEFLLTPLREGRLALS